MKMDEYWVGQLINMAGLSCEEAADILGYSLGSVMDHARGNKSGRNHDFTNMFIECLGVDPEWLTKMRSYEKMLIENWRFQQANRDDEFPRPSKIEGNPFKTGKPVIKQFSTPAFGTKAYRREQLKDDSANLISPPGDGCFPARRPLRTRLRLALRAFRKAWSYQGIGE